MPKEEPKEPGPRISLTTFAEGRHKKWKNYEHVWVLRDVIVSGDMATNNVNSDPTTLKQQQRIQYLKVFPASEGQIIKRKTKIDVPRLLITLHNGDGSHIINGQGTLANIPSALPILPPKKVPDVDKEEEGKKSKKKKNSQKTTKRSKKKQEEEEEEEIPEEKLTYKTPFVFQITEANNKVHTFCSNDSDRRRMWVRFLSAKCRPLDLADLKLAYLDCGEEEDDVEGMNTNISTVNSLNRLNEREEKEGGDRPPGLSDKDSRGTNAPVQARRKSTMRNKNGFTRTIKLRMMHQNDALAQEWVKLNMTNVEQERSGTVSETKEEGPPKRTDPQKSSKYNIEWAIDQDYPNCYECQIKFTMFRRRHHCRLCGHIFCGKCCKVKVVVEGSRNRKRVCVKCL
jgi:hypothetical protein